MLTRLTIKNYALIKEVQLEIPGGFTVITGETGAGKSILLGALGLLTGRRADISSIGDPSSKCIIEGTFDVENYGLKRFFNDTDLDYEAQTIVRRELLPSGKSRAFINDTPVTLQQLSLLGDRVVDIHSQHKTLEVAQASFQTEVLDTLAKNDKVLKDYKEAYVRFRESEFILNNLLDEKANAQRDYDYNAFLLEELVAANVQVGEYEHIEQRLSSLSNAETIAESLQNAFQGLAADDLGVVDRVAAIKNLLEQAAKYDATYRDALERLQSTYLELTDLAGELERYVDDVVMDPEALAEVTARYELLTNLMQKHRAADTEELLAIWESLSVKVSASDEIDSKIAQAETERAVLLSTLEQLAQTLSERRGAIVPHLKNRVESILQNLGLEHARLEVAIARAPALGAVGNDVVNFLFTANKGTQPQPLGKGASGGELSRVMLAIKAVVSRQKQLATLIFDEIDTGVSGAIAQKMGHLLRSMGSKLQILSITHLPQIAGQGEAHFKVSKAVHGNRTETAIQQLDPEERVIEIAAMLGSDTVSDSALQHAKSLLN